MNEFNYEQWNTANDPTAKENNFNYDGWVYGDGPGSGGAPGKSGQYDIISTYNDDGSQNIKIVDTVTSETFSLRG